MTTTHRYLVHSLGPALWPEQRPLREVQALHAETVETVWEATYQGNPTPPAGYTFKRKWWQRGANRYDAADNALKNLTVGRYVSLDTAEKADEVHDYTAVCVGELLPDYQLVIRYMLEQRVEFPELTDLISAQIRRWDYDNKLKALIIEDKSSGTQAIQTLRASAAPEIRDLLVAWQPAGDKVQRYQQAAVWCRNGMVLLPHPSAAAPWLLDFEDQLFSLPEAVNDDQGDAFAQLIIYLENYLSAGFHGQHKEPDNE